MNGQPADAAFLRSCGFSAASAAAKAELFARCATALGELGSATPEASRAYFVPGRIEVLGKHTDYAGGSSLVAAAERGFCLIASATRDPQVRVTDAVRGETIRFPLDSDLTASLGHWSNYPQTVARRMARNFPGLAHGADIALASDLPPAAGMSSSSALMVAIFFALADANDIWGHERFLPELNEPLNLAGYLATIENGQSYGPLAGDRGVGTFGGSEDHTAILCAGPDASASTPIARQGSSGRCRYRPIGRSPSPPAAWPLRKPAPRWRNTIARRGWRRPWRTSGAAKPAATLRIWRRWCGANPMQPTGCGRLGRRESQRVPPQRPADVGWSISSPKTNR